MAYNGYKRYLGIAKETTYGTAISPTKWLDIISESIKGEPTNLPIETAGQREITGAIPGPWKQSGSFDMLAQPDVMGEILMAVFGKVTTQSGTTAYEHTFEPEETIGSLTLEIYPGKIGTEARPRQVPGAIMKSVKLEAVARELCAFSVDVVAQDEELLTTSTFTAHTDGADPFVFWQGAVTWDAGAITGRVEAFRITFENEIDEDAFSLGSRLLTGCFVEGCKISGELDITFTNWDEYQRIYGGDESKTGPISAIGDLDYFVLKLVLTGGTTGDATYTNYELEIECKNILLDTAEANFNKRERIVEGVGFTGYLRGTDKLTTWKLVNKVASY